METKATLQISQELEKKLLERGMDRKDFVKINSFLAQLRDYHYPTYEHSERVGSVCFDIAKFTNVISPIPLSCAGRLHDIGKLEIKKELLEKYVNWNSEDEKQMQEHVYFGFKRLIGFSSFYSWTTLLSHRLKDGYPSEVPEWAENSSGKSEVAINYTALIVGIADSFDAAKYRKDDYGSPGNPRILNSREVRQLLLRQNPHQSKLIKDLYRVGIFE